MDFEHLDVDQVDGYGRTSLHIAAKRGNLEIVRYILSVRPELATEVDFNGASPLHLASANGHLEVVRHLLNVNRNTCLLQDKNGNTPLHMAVKRGQIEVVRHLSDVNQDAFFLENDKGNTPLHVAANINQIAVAELLISRLHQQAVQGVIKHTANMQKCVIRCGPEALEQIIEADPNFLNGCDNEDLNTLLHTATRLRSEEMVRFLVQRNDVSIAKNKNGLTALDIIEISSKNYHDQQIWTLLKRHADKWEPRTGNFKNKRGALLVATSIIASMALTCGFNPPGGLWQEDKQCSGDNHNASIGTSVMAFTNPSMYKVFLRVITSAFVLSMCLIMLLISEIHLSQNIFMHLLTGGVWFAITLIGFTYFQALYVITPMTVNKNVVIFMGIISLFVWVVLTGIILLDRANRSTYKHNANNPANEQIELGTRHIRIAP